MKDVLFTSLTANEEANLSGGRAARPVTIRVNNSAVNGSGTINGDASVVGGPDSTNNTTSGGNTITSNGTPVPIPGTAFALVSALTGGSNNATGVKIG